MSSSSSDGLFGKESKVSFENIRWHVEQVRVPAKKIIFLTLILKETMANVIYLHMPQIHLDLDYYSQQHPKENLLLCLSL